jgi:hypothetical protein
MVSLVYASPDRNELRSKVVDLKHDPILNKDMGLPLL